MEPIVLSVGGSLIVPNGGINIPFLIKLNTFIRKNVAKKRRFFIVAGGGSTAREYIEAGREVIKKIPNEDLDWLGIHSTHLNAHLLRTIFRDIAHYRIVENYDKKIRNLKEPVIIGGGWKPGWSTDYDAVLFSRDYGANLIINLSNIYYVYNKDPRKFKDAIRIEKTTWSYFETLVGSKWVPGLSAPFDPIAAQLAKDLRLTVIVTKGDDFRNLQRILDGDSFKGSVITPYQVSGAYYDRPYYLGEKGEYNYLYANRVTANIMQSTANWYRALYIKLQFKPKRVLDVGCGTGELVRCLRALGVDARGVDISNEALELASDKVRPYLAQGDISNLPYKDDEFDMVVSFDVMEHFERSIIKKAIKETIRVSSKYILHKIYTKENSFINYLHGSDHSHLSVFHSSFWEELFNALPNVTMARKFYQLPDFFESVYFLKKNLVHA